MDGLLPGLLVITVTLAVVSSQTIQPPANTSALVGGNATFNCNPTDPSQNFVWVALLQASDSPLFIYDKNDGGLKGDPNKYEVDETSYSLTIKNIAISDTGTYSCYVTTSQFLTAILVAIGVPEVTATPFPFVTGEYGEIGCIVEYGARKKNSLPLPQIPQIRLLLEGVTLDGAVPVTEEVEPDFHYRLKSTLNATALKDYDEMPFECVVYTNTPATEDSANITLNVTYPVSEISHNSPDSELSVGEMVTCISDGNPPPTFRWAAQSTPGDRQVVDSHDLDITVDMTREGGRNNWTCTASNPFNDSTYSVELVFEFTAYAGAVPPPDAGGVEPWVIAIAVIIPLLVIITVAVVIFLVMNKKKKKEKHSSVPTYEVADNSYPYTTRSQQVPLNMASSRPPPPTTLPPNYPPVSYNGNLPGKTSPGSGDLGIRFFGASGINPQTGYSSVSQNPGGHPGMANGRTSAPSSGRSSPSTGYPSGGAFV